MPYLGSQSVQLYQTPPHPLIFMQLALAQESDPELSCFQTGSTSHALRPVPLSTTDVTLICDTSIGSPRPFVPERFRRSIFDSLHGLAHPGIRATQKLFNTRYVWPGINSVCREALCQTHCNESLVASTFWRKRRSGTTLRR